MRSYAMTVRGARRVFRFSDADAARYPGAVPVETAAAPRPENKSGTPKKTRRRSPEK